MALLHKSFNITSSGVESFYNCTFWLSYFSCVAAESRNTVSESQNVKYIAYLFKTVLVNHIERGKKRNTDGESTMRVQLHV